MKNILFTFDYELFLGKKSGTAQKCLIKPTELIRVLLKEYECKAIFFVDTTYLLELEKKASEHPQALRDLNAIVAQLGELSMDGHDIFPHLHPHWIDAKYDAVTNEWSLENTSRYRFHGLSKQEKEVMFSESMRMLADILRKFKHPARAMGYRAGGWCLQPFEDFSPFFARYNIRYDFSVLKGAFCNSNVRYYDFRNLQNEPAIFRFSDDVSKPENDGLLTEFCISMLKPLSKPEDYLARIIYKSLPASFKNNYGDGLSAVLHEQDSEDAGVTDNKSPGVMASIELMNVINLRHHFTYLRRENFLQFISHPKMLSDYNLSIFGIFLKKLHARYSVETDFRKMY